MRVNMRIKSFCTLVVLKEKKIENILGACMKYLIILNRISSYNLNCYKIVKSIFSRGGEISYAFQAQ